MSFLFPQRHDDADLERWRQEANTALARKFENDGAEASDTVECRVLATVPAWLRERTDRGCGSAWMFSSPPRADIRQGAEDFRPTIPVPLPDRKVECARRRAS